MRRHVNIIACLYLCACDDDDAQKKKQKMHNAANTHMYIYLHSHIYTQAAPGLAHARDPQGQTALHLAALHDAPLPVMRALLKGGVDPRAVDRAGDTAAEVNMHRYMVNMHGVWCVVEGLYNNIPTG